MTNIGLPLMLVGSGVRVHREGHVAKYLKVINRTNKPRNKIYPILHLCVYVCPCWWGWRKEQVLRNYGLGTFPDRQTDGEKGHG